MNPRGVSQRSTRTLSAAQSLFYAAIPRVRILQRPEQRAIPAALLYRSRLEVSGIGVLEVRPVRRALSTISRHVSRETSLPVYRGNL